VRRRPGRPRSRRLDGDEEQRLLAQCRRARNPWLAHFVLLAIETGMRRGELLRLQWTHIDFDKRTAFLPMTKNGESRAVPLSSPAITLLRSICGNLGQPAKAFEAAVQAETREGPHR